MLKQDWLFDKHIDLEYKQYVVLDYIQKLEACAERLQLQPALTQLSERLNDLLHFSGELENIKKHRRDKELIRLDFKNKQLIYKTEDDSLFLELEGIVNFALPLLFNKYDELIKLHDDLLNSLVVVNVGIYSINSSDAGYFFLKNGLNVSLFEYIRYPLFESEENEFISFRLSREYGSNFEFNSLKSQHIIEEGLVVPPNYFLISSDRELPLEETLLPLCRKRFQSMWRHLSSNHL